MKRERICVCVWVCVHFVLWCLMLRFTYRIYTLCFFISASREKIRWAQAKKKKKEKIESNLTWFVFVHQFLFVWFCSRFFIFCFGDSTQVLLLPIECAMRFHFKWIKNVKILRKRMKEIERKTNTEAKDRMNEHCAHYNLSWKWDLR